MRSHTHTHTHTHTHMLPPLSSGPWSKGFNPAERFQCHLLRSEMSLRQPAGLHAALCKKIFFQAAIYRPVSIWIAATFVLFPSHPRMLLCFLNPITPTCWKIQPLTFSIHTHHIVQETENTYTTCPYMSFQVINQQVRGQFRFDVTFKVLFSLYIQYTSQKYTVDLQRRSVRYTIKSAAGNDRFLDEGYKVWSVFECFIVPVFSPCFYIQTDVTVEAMLKNDKFLGLR